MHDATLRALASPPVLSPFFSCFGCLAETTGDPVQARSLTCRHQLLFGLLQEVKVHRTFFDHVETVASVPSRHWRLRTLITYAFAIAIRELTENTEVE